MTVKHGWYLFLQFSSTNLLRTFDFKGSVKRVRQHLALVGPTKLEGLKNLNSSLSFEQAALTFCLPKACEQALWGALAVGQEKKGELATTSMEFEYLH